MVDVGRCDSGPRVSDMNRNVIAVRSRAHRHVSMLGSELDGVAHDVPHELRDAEWIRANGDPVVWRDRIEIDVALFRHGAERLLGLMEDRDDLYLFEVELELARVNAHRVEKVADQAVHLSARPKCDIQQLHSPGPVEILLEQQIRAGNDEVERIAEI